MSHREQFKAVCPVCAVEQVFSSADDFWDCRDGMVAADCPMAGCSTRERALAAAMFSIIDREAVASLAIHEAGPLMRGLSLWLRNHCAGYVPSGYFPGEPFGVQYNGIRNEDLERQTFSDETFDLVIHLDVLEHLFDPFLALEEIYRTLKPGGLCMFTAPTEPQRFQSEQVAFINEGVLSVTGEPEYHGNPQGEGSGALVTWRYGFDLPLQIQRRTGFDVETRRYQSRSIAAMGYMNDVYVLRKR